MAVTDEPRVFVSKLQTLVRAAMPELGLEAQEQLVSEQLTRSVPSQWRLRLLDCEVTTTEGLIRRLERIKTTEQLQKELGSSSIPVRNVNQRSGRVGVEPRTCFKCGKRGYIAVNCRSAPGATNVSPGPDHTCFQCGGWGHVKRQCPSLQQWHGRPLQQETSQPTALQAGQQSQPAGGHPGAAVNRHTPASRPPREVRRLGTMPTTEMKAVVLLNGVKAEGVLDTGSAVSLISMTVVEDLALEVTDVQDIKCLAANGTEVDVKGQVEVELQVGKSKLVHPLSVSEGLTDQLLLGLDVLTKFNMIIDCGTREMMIGDEVVGTRPSGSSEVSSRCPVVCTARSQTFVHIRRVMNEEVQLFQPSEVTGVKIAPSLHLSHQGTPVRILNLGEEDVIIPAGTVLGTQESITELSQPERSDVNEDNQDLKLPSVEHLNPDDKKQFEKLLVDYKDVFSQSTEDIGAYKGSHQMVINTMGKEPVRQRGYRTPLHLRALLRESLDTLKGQGVIEDSTSPWASPVVMIRKKDGGIRICCDYRAVNAVIKHDSYPLPRIEDILHTTRKARVYTVLDQRAAYWAIPIAPESREVTAFISEYGLQQWTRQPFGLKTSPGVFQRIMEDVLEGLNWETAVVYLDDVIVYSSSMAEHLIVLKQVLDRFREAGLKLHPDKCQVAVKKVNFLGHQLDETGIRPTEDKVEAVKHWPRPSNVQEVRRFLGMVGYYRQYVPHFADKSVHLTNLLQKESLWRWTAECETEFQNLKKDLQWYPVLQSPDPEEKFILTTDASSTGWGAELSQSAGVKAFASGKWTPTEKNWSVTERELGAVVKASSKFHHYLVGQPFLLRTDHEAIKYMQRSKCPSGRLFRWIEQLQQYDYTVEHVPGVLNRL